MHDIPLDQYLVNIVGNKKFPQDTRDLAQSMLNKWNLGVIPSQKSLLRLAKEITPPPDCGRLQYDGACPWLRKHGEAHNLVVPPPGERAMCVYRGMFSQCPGYVKDK